MRCPVAVLDRYERDAERLEVRNRRSHDAGGRGRRLSPAAGERHARRRGSPERDRRRRAAKKAAACGGPVVYEQRSSILQDLKGRGAARRERGPEARRRDHRRAGGLDAFRPRPL